MILPDVNVLVYAHRTDMTEHQPYARWLTATAQGGEPFALTAATVSGFVRIVTHPKVFTTPSPIATALDFVDALTESPSCRWIEPSDRWWAMFADLSRRAGTRGNVVPDAALAAIAVDHGCRLATADRGFARFPDLTYFDPLDVGSA